MYFADSKTHDSFVTNRVFMFISKEKDSLHLALALASKLHCVTE